MLSHKVVCSHHFSGVDFTSADCIHLNTTVVATFCAPTSLSHSAAPPRVEPTFYIRPVSSLSPLVACAVIDVCQNAGLVVVATMCDMGANSVKALKQFGVCEKMPFLRFHDQEIAAAFDPPHLLKCMLTCSLNMI
jgi:hypothetical protein